MGVPSTLAGVGRSLLLLIPLLVTGCGLVQLCPSFRFRFALSHGIRRFTRSAYPITLCATTMIQKEKCDSSVTIPPSVIIGGGRIGLALRGLGSGGDVLVERGQNFPSYPSDGPIYVRAIFTTPLSRVL